MTVWRRAPRADEGETLIELVVAIAILAITVVAIGAGIAASVIVVDRHRKETTAGVVAKSYAEAIQNWVANNHYSTCAASYAPATVGFTVPTGFSVSISGISAWTQGNPGSWVNCTAGTDKGVQRFSITANSTDTGNRGSEQLYVVVRNSS